MVAIVAALLLAAAVLFAIRQPLERALLQIAIARATGANVVLGAVSDGLTSLRLDDVHLDADGTALDVPRADVRIRGPFDLVLHAPHATVVYGQPPVVADSVAATVAWLRRMRARLQLRDGSIDVLPAAAANSVLHLDAVNGRLALGGAAETYELNADIIASGRTYPVAARAAALDGEIHREWAAAALPLAPLAALQPAAALTVTAGELRDVDLTQGDGVAATATLVDVNASAGGHSLRALSGTLVARDGHLGSSGISGTLNGAPFSFAGEIHDAGDPVLALRDGTAQLRVLQRLLTTVAAQPALRYARLETTAPGVAFAQFGERSPIGPRVISLLAVDPAEPSVKLGTAISADHVISKGERTSQLAQRTGAVAGVNGDYFDIGRSYEPQGLLVRDGAIVRGPTDRAALVIDRANNVRFAEFHLNGTVATGGRSYPITQINTWPPGDATVITPDYGTQLAPAPGATFVRLVPIDAARHLFRATSVESAAAGLPVSFGIGFGPLLAGATQHVGDRFRLNYALEPSVADVAAGIGGGPILLKDGAWYEDPHAPAPAERDVRWPVVALGTLPDGLLLFAAVDGRHPERAVGMTRPEFADLLRRCGVRDAMALDSGGSVTLVSRAPGAPAASVRNTPSDDQAERYISDALLVFSSAPPDELVTPEPAPSAPPAPANRP